MGDFILILNADIIVLREAIQKMLKFLETNKDVGIVAPRLEDYTGNLQISCFSDPLLSIILARRTFWGKTKKGRKTLEKISILHDNDSPKEVDWVQSSAMMFKKIQLIRLDYGTKNSFVF